MMIIPLGGDRLARGRHRQGPVFDPPDALQLIGKGLERMAFPLYHQHLQTIMVIKMDVEDGFDLPFK